MKSVGCAVLFALAGGMGSAQEISKCRFDYTCANITPCQPAKAGQGDGFELEMLSNENVRLDLGGKELPLLKAQKVSDDLMTAHGWDTARSTSYTLSLFADGMVAYTTHTFVGQGVSLTSLGRCEETG